MSKFLLLLGPSGVGKSSIIEELCHIDDRFVYISPFMTRPLRDGEKNKISVSREQMEKIRTNGELLVVNELYGVQYATPRLPIEEALSSGKFPILDWPVSRIEVMVQAFPGLLYVTYVLPPSIEVLGKRLANDNRDIDGRRLQCAHEELEAYQSDKYFGIYDLEIMSEENQVEKIARVVYDSYLRSFGSQD